MGHMFAKLGREGCLYGTGISFNLWYKSCVYILCVCVYHYSVYNGLVGFASPLVTDRDSECASPVSTTQTSFAAGRDLQLFSQFISIYIQSGLGLILGITIRCWV